MIHQGVRSLSVTILLVIAFYFIVNFCATDIVMPIYSFYNPRSISTWEHLAALCCAVAPVLLLRRDDMSPGTCATWILYYLGYLGTAIIAVTLLPDLSTYLGLMGFLLLSLFVFYWTSTHPIIKITRWGFVFPHAERVMLCLMLTLVFCCWYLADFTVRVGIDDVYERRAEAREGIGLWGYALAPLRILLPVLAIYAWYSSKSVVWVSVLVVSCYAIFSFDGTKSSFLFPLFLALCMYGIAKENISMVILLVMVLVGGVAVIEYFGLGSTLVSDYFMRRSYVVPAILSAAYYTSDLRGVDLSTVTYQVGMMQFGSSLANANSNMWMWGYAWGGVAGGVLVSFVAGSMVSIFSVFPGRKFPGMGALMGTGCALIWSEQFLHTSMLSNGLLYLLIVAIAMKSSPASFPILRDQNMKRA